MSDWINSNEGHIRTRNNAFFLTLLLCVFILIEMALMGGGEKKKADSGRDHEAGQPQVSSNRGALLT